MSQMETYDAVVVGGGPAGATAASDLARAGRKVLLLDKDGRIKPCGGAIPPRLIRDFEIPDALLVGKARSACMVSPSDRRVDMPINGGYVGMVDRDVFDEWLRERARAVGAERRKATFREIDRDDDGTAIVRYTEKLDDGAKRECAVRARAVIGTDGANSAVGKQCIPGADAIPYVAAYHEIIESPPASRDPVKFTPDRCDVFYQGKLSPDFYAWVFPHGHTTSIGVGSANKGFSLRKAVAELRDDLDLADAPTVRREGAPIPLKPLKRWDNGRDVIVAGDAAGIVAPASGEGIYYAMVGGRLAAEAVEQLCATGNPRALRSARKRFMRDHGKVFFILGQMQKFWYSSDKRRERFVSICEDEDVQHLTWEAYMNKRLVKAKPAAHLRIFLKDMAHLLGIVSPWSKQKQTG